MHFLINLHNSFCNIVAPPSIMFLLFYSQSIPFPCQGNKSHFQSVLMSQKKVLPCLPRNLKRFGFSRLHSQKFKQWLYINIYGLILIVFNYLVNFFFYFKLRTSAQVHHQWHQRSGLLKRVQKEMKFLWKK